MRPLSYFIQDEMKEFSHEQRAHLRKFWLLNYQANKRRIPSDKKFTDLPDLMWARPVAVLGAGGIARATFELLSTWDDLTVVACDKVLPRVVPYLRPDFVVALNTELTPDVRLEEWFRHGNDVGLIVPVTVHPRTVELWKGEVYWTNPTNVDDDLQMLVQQEQGLQPFHRGLNVGEFGVSMAAFMRPAEIGLFGMWYAWRTRRQALAGQPRDNYDVVELRNGGERWWTTISWLSGRSSFIQFCKNLVTQGIEIFNASEGGILYHPEYCRPTGVKEFRERWP